MWRGGESARPLGALGLALAGVLVALLVLAYSGLNEVLGQCGVRGDGCGGGGGCGRGLAGAESWGTVARRAPWRAAVLVAPAAALLDYSSRWRAPCGPALLGTVLVLLCVIEAALAGVSAPLVEVLLALTALAAAGAGAAALDALPAAAAVSAAAGGGKPAWVLSPARGGGSAATSVEGAAGGGQRQLLPLALLLSTYVAAVAAVAGAVPLARAPSPVMFEALLVCMPLLAALCETAFVAVGSLYRSSLWDDGVYLAAASLGVSLAEALRLGALLSLGEAWEVVVFLCVNAVAEVVRRTDYHRVIAGWLCGAPRGRVHRFKAIYLGAKLVTPYATALCAGALLALRYAPYGALGGPCGGGRIPPGVPPRPAALVGAFAVYAAVDLGVCVVSEGLGDAIAMRVSTGPRAALANWGSVCGGAVLVTEYALYAFGGGMYAQ